MLMYRRLARSPTPSSLRGHTFAWSQNRSFPQPAKCLGLGLHHQGHGLLDGKLNMESCLNICILRYDLPAEKKPDGMLCQIFMPEGADMQPMRSTEVEISEIRTTDPHDAFQSH